MVARKSTEDNGDKMGITISMDYCFLTTEGESETDPKVVVMHDDRLDAIWALEVKAKGPSAEVVTWIVGKLEESGYRGTAIALKTDQEESIMALKRAVMARREARTTPIESKVRVSVSNAHVERAIRKWRGQSRKPKIH